MNDVVVTFANGKKKSYIYLSDEVYKKGKESGWIVGCRPITEFERKIEKLLSKLRIR